MKLFFYDLETTGTMVHRHGIHQISGMIVIDGQIKETFDFKVAPNPAAQIDDAALAVGNVTRDQILNYPPMDQVYHQIVGMLSKYVNKFDRTDKFFLVGYNNAAFDNAFFRAFFVQNGDKYFGSWFWSNTFDVMVLATPALSAKRAEMQDFKQATVAGTLGVAVDPEKLHDASYDIVLCKAIFDKVCGIV